ncbi:MAG: aldehyde dehydrogenase family protein [bacterium]
MSNMGSFINGKWFMPSSKKRIHNVNPASLDEVVADFPAASSEDALRAIEAAEAAYSGWSSVPAPERGRYIARAATIARQRLDEIARMITLEEGKILPEAKGETLKGINVLEFFAGEGFRIQGSTFPSEVPNTTAYTIRQPLGPVGVISPWNFPWAIPCWKIAPALVAGNTVVFKPASLTPLTAAILIEILDEAGLPPGVCNMVVGSGSDVGNTIVKHPGIKAISFTGSNEVGVALYVEASRRLAKVTCEMGGKNPLVVLDDADIDKAVKAIIGSAFGSTGQRCTATSRLIVQPSVKKTLLDILVDKAESMKVGNGMMPDIEMGPAVDRSQLETDLGYCEIAKSEGAKLLVGGCLDTSAGNGHFIRPTIFDCVTPDMRLFQEEVFGPVLAVTEAKDFDEALRLANNSRYGLTSAIFTNDFVFSQRFINEIHSGMTHINEPTIGGEAQLPFGGIRATGVGDREMSQIGLNFFTEIKTVFVNYAPTGERSMIR